MSEAELGHHRCAHFFCAESYGEYQRWRQGLCVDGVSGERIEGPTGSMLYQTYRNGGSSNTASQLPAGTDVIRGMRA